MLVFHHSLEKAIPLISWRPFHQEMLHKNQTKSSIYLSLFSAVAPLTGLHLLSFWLTLICWFYNLAVLHVVITATTHTYVKSHCHKPEASKISACPRTPPAQPFSHICEISFQRHQPTHPQVYKKHLTWKLSQAGLSKPGCQQQC